MTLSELLNGVKILECAADTTAEITGIANDSRNVCDGNIFVALTGGEADGHDYATHAIQNGALCVVTQKPVDAPYVLVDDTRKALALMAANFYGNSHKRLKIITVVGTNGKTTTTCILNEILKGDGKKTAVIGTLGADICGKKVITNLTTPDPMQLHALFAQAESAGAEYVIMEASAHALYYRKLEGIIAEAGIFTNISQDHLDFFETMDRYAEVKTEYFDFRNMKVGIVNIDDAYGRKITNNNKVVCLKYGIDYPADVFAVNYIRQGASTCFVVNMFDDIADIAMPLIGKFNLYNALAAIATAKALKVSKEAIRRALISIKEVEGRFNIIKNKITVIIDYAHTPAGLENLLKAAKELDGGRLITVFGCGGDRDRAKRPIMGRIAEEYSDFCIVTSDNPRMEPPFNIIAEIERGMKGYDHICIVERQHAISYAIAYAQEGDKVVVAGKGAENYLDIMGRKIPYSDKEAVMAALENKF